MNNNIGKYFNPITTFRSEDSIFTKGVRYKLIDIEQHEILTLYIFEGGLIYGTIKGVDNFRDKFIMSQENRLRKLNKILYED